MAIGRPISLTPNIATKNISSVATADQTEFTVTGGYRINEIAVYRNGVRLAEGRDFTASDGDTVNLVTGATVDDVIEFAVFDSFNVSDAIVSAASSQNLNGDFNVTGTLYAGTFEPGQFVAGIVTANTALYVGSALTANAAGDVQSIGIITAASFSGDGSALTGLANTDYVVSVATTTGNLTVSAAATIGGAVNIDATTDSTSTSTGALIVDGGLGVAKNVYIGAGLSVAGTLTYEDVTSVDSVGLITAKSGVNITGGELTVGSGITMGIAGVATFSGTSDVHLLDNVQLKIGDGSDLTITHDGTQSKIIDAGSGTLHIQNTSGNVDFASHGSSVQLQINKSGIKNTGITTTVQLDVSSNLIVGSGITIGSAGVATFSGTSDVHLLDNVRLNVGDGSDLAIYHDGSDSRITNSTGALQITGNNDFRIKTNGGQNIFKATGNLVELYYDTGSGGSSKKFETTNDGTVTTGIATATGGLEINADSKKLQIGAGSDLQIYTDGSNSIISHDGDGDLQILAQGSGEDVTIKASENVDLYVSSSEIAVHCDKDGAVQLRHNNNTKLETSSGGISVTGSVAATNYTGDGSALTGVGGEFDITSCLFV